MKTCCVSTMVRHQQRRGGDESCVLCDSAPLVLCCLCVVVRACLLASPCFCLCFRPLVLQLNSLPHPPHPLPYPTLPTTDRLFPISLFFQWLSYGDRELIKRREFTFWKEEVCQRYKVYSTKDEFKKDLMRKMPFKIDFGGVYNASPTMRDTVKNFHPEQKELVFDIDMTDYDDVRVCCDGANICHKCWTLMTAAIKVSVAGTSIHS